MSVCTPTPTATLYGLVTTYTPSTSYSLSGAQGVLSTITQESCILSGTITGSSLGCISSIPITQVTTIAGAGQVQVPVIVSIPVTESSPTQTLFSSCTGGSSSSQSSSQTPSPTVLTTSVLIETTPPPSTATVQSTTTLADGSVVQTLVTVLTTQPPTSVYVPTTSVVAPTVQANHSQGTGTNVAPIIGGVLGGFVGLAVIVGSLWWLCRRRRRWDDIFEKDDNDIWASSTTERRPRGRGVDSSAEPRPYQYGLVGRVVAPTAAGERLKSSRYESVNELSGPHSRQTSLSATPLLQGSRSSRPSTSASIHTQPGPRVRSTFEAEPRSLSMASYSSNTGVLVDGNQSTPALLDNWTPNTDDLAALDPLNRTERPVSSEERRVLQIVNEGPDTGAGGARQGQTTLDVIMHTDGGPAAEGDVNPPAYSR